MRYLDSIWTAKLRCHCHCDFNSRILHHGYSTWSPSFQRYSWGYSSKWNGSGLIKLSHRSIHCRRSYRLQNSLHHPRATRQGIRQLGCVPYNCPGGRGHQRKDQVSRYKYHCQHLEPVTHKVRPIYSSSNSRRHEKQQRRTLDDSFAGNLWKLSNFVA